MSASEETCPICDGRSRPAFQVHGIGIHECTRCGHRFARPPSPHDHVDRVYGDAYFRGGGAGYPDYLGEGPLLTAHGRRYARLLRRHTAPGTMLDVGAAAGFILRGFVEEGWRGTGVEPNPAMAAHAREQLGLDVRTGTLETLDTPDRFDLVSMIQVVAHFTDPRAALARAAEMTRPGGFWLLETWDRESVTARLLGRRWHEYSPPSVLHWFFPAGLRDLGGRLGMTEVARGRPAKRLQAGHAASLLRYKFNDSAAGRVLAAPLRAVPRGLTLPYILDDLFWMLFRKA